MIHNQSEYKLTYKECSRSKNHYGEKLNYICLQEKCKLSSLICSLCRQQFHKNHKTQPLKFFFARLSQNYKQNKTNYDTILYKMQQQKKQCLMKFQQSIENIAEQAKKIEQQIIHYFESAREAVIQEKSNKDKFLELYKSLINRQSQAQAPDFLIYNYLPVNDLKGIGQVNIPNFKELHKVFEQTSVNIIKSLSISKPKSSQKVLIKWLPIDKIDSQSTLLKAVHIPEVIKINNNNFVQSDSKSKQSMCIIPLDFRKMALNEKITITIDVLGSKSFIYMGLIEDEYAKTLDFMTPMHRSQYDKKELDKQIKDNVYYLNNQGLSLNSKKCEIKTFSHNSTTSIYRKKNQANTLVMDINKKSAQFEAPANKNYFLFFSLLGNISIKLNFIKK